MMKSILLLATAILVLPAPARSMTRLVQGDGWLELPMQSGITGVQSAKQYDADGDGFADLPHTQSFQGLIVDRLDGTNILTWTPSIQDFCASCSSTDNWYVNFIGFGDFDVTSGRECVVFWEDLTTARYGLAVVSNPQGLVLQVFEEPGVYIVVRGITDLNGDNTDELILDFDNNYFEVWGYGTSTAVGSRHEEAVKQTTGPFEVRRHYPDPARGALSIVVNAPNATTVDCAVYGPDGRRVRDLRNVSLGSGANTLTWDGRDDSGALVPTGVYLFRVERGGYQQAGKVTVLR